MEPMHQATGCDEKHPCHDYICQNVEMEYNHEGTSDEPKHFTKGHFTK